MNTRISMIAITALRILLVASGLAAPGLTTSVAQASGTQASGTQATGAQATGAQAPAASTPPATANIGARRHAIAMHGTPALPAGFAHFPYVVPDAPRGGRLTIAENAAFDSLNPFIPKGSAPTGISSLVYERLLARSADEPFTLYGLVARSIEVADDRSWIIFHLDPRARFSDGRPITPADIVFSHDILRRKGQPYMRSHYRKVAAATIEGPRSVKFRFAVQGDRELPLIIGLMPILPRHATDPETFDRTTLVTPIGSGPYVVDKALAPHSITYRRNPNYWAADHPARRGMYNFDEIRVVYYRDDTAVFEAFKTGEAHFRAESDPARWIDGYDFPAMRDGRARKLALPIRWPAGMQGLVFNTRQPKFADIRVRRAFTLAFDGPSINQSIFHGRFERSESFFARSDLASSGRPADAVERALLAPFPGAVQPGILAGTWQLPRETSSKGRRARLKQAHDLLNEAGYSVRDGRMLERRTGKPLTVELLVVSTGQQRIAVLFAAPLRRLGITVQVRKVEASQYWARLASFDFDMIQFAYSASLSPGNEQYNRWSSKAADVSHSLNFAAVRNPAVDAMIDAMLSATGRAEFESAVRAFDRVLLSGHYLIPLFHLPEQWLALSRVLKIPPHPPLRGTDFSLWWFSPAK